ncbi:ScbA/BarX family gamma-butyrolactone biosynthesis protein [Streptomyces sp. DSM 41527]|uniref:ScbA/BarX family gamma-butyrolactone biosynthesis protein n=1 Tax=Streptomyces mooreae TaxID=3075523 RepID=A0ABU2T906_9ACTN|nr:ScbA/BarX family gamma-butyrolactone biosynthesis protein [Streptomyces sp. DSM 41527]MDT0457416.1 ScbA/BarX family gamma-butyrolactone biosynthesis protein [Streptomyces sp. DSM 41527]
MAGATLTPYSRDQRHDLGGRFADGIQPSELTMTVPREYVHRAAVSEVFLTNWRGDDDGWVVSAQWPRAHTFYGPVHGLHDPVLLIETVRQTGILLSHVAYQVPLDHPIIWQRVRYDLAPQALRTADHPAEVTLHVTDHDVVRRGSRLVSVHQEFRIVCDGADLASATLVYSCHSPAVYRRLRGEYSDLALANSRKLPLPQAVAPQLVARERDRDVVLSPTDRPDRWQLRVDTSHPVLFDHPVDHAPGMLIVEAARQAAQAAAPGFTVPASMDCTFERYAELDAPTWVEARTTDRTDGGRRQVEVAVEQHDKPVVSAQITCVPTP